MNLIWKKNLSNILSRGRIPKSVVRHTFGLVRPRTGHFQDLLDRTMENVVRPGTDDVGPWSAMFVLGIITELGNTDLPNLKYYLFGYNKYYAFAN